ncbi:MAG: UDP-glucose/GDP-mannose dehydrogenase family protein [Proteobacteria bacterium]|nr:UDP-glucose/GDP-mannose dehydrogenase family protein [Pseudomonadota bacterium]
MRIAMIGTGYVGLVSGVCFSDFGHQVVCIDRDGEKIARLDRGEVPIYEPGLEALMRKNIAAGRLTFSTDLAAGMKDAEAVFISVGTPARRGDGHADLSYVYAAAEAIAAQIDDYLVVITKSTVPVGTNREVARRIRAARPEADFDVVSNPEFLREGAAIEDFMRPDRIVVGLESDRARAVIAEVYRPLFLRETPIIQTGLESAEMIKYAANAFLATKITFINEIADLCEKVGADVQSVARGIGLDRRIGPKFLHAGPGYGGSCFPKDTLALVETARAHDSPVRIVSTVVEANEARKRAMAGKIIAAAGGSVAGKRIAVLGVTFKPNTDDMREAPSLVIVPALREAGAEIVLCDPQGRKEGEALLGEASWAGGPYEAAESADILVLITEWNEFRALDFGRIRAAMKGDLIVDLRNVYLPAEVRAAGFSYVSIGRS